MSLKEHLKYVNCLKQLADGRLISCSDDKMLKVWNVNTLECESTLIKNNFSVNCFVQLRNDDNTIILWDIVKLEYNALSQIIKVEYVA